MQSDKQTVVPDKQTVVPDKQTIVPKAVICLCGNDGTGKSTLIGKIKQYHLGEYLGIQRSMKGLHPMFQSLRQEIKYIDKLTFRYPFEQDREKFQPTSSINITINEQILTIPVYWIMLDLDPLKIRKRIDNREEMGIYESKKCIEYYSYVYLELAYYYGMTVVNVEPKPDEICNHMMSMIESRACSQIKQISIRTISHEFICKNDIENIIQKSLTNEQAQLIYEKEVLHQLISNAATKILYFPILDGFIKQHDKQEWNHKLLKELSARWILKNHTIEDEAGKSWIKFKIGDMNSTIELLSAPWLSFTIEGQSKKIYQIKSGNKLVQDYFTKKIIIILKSTIYSHTKQHTGQIESLASIRAQGSNLFLEMMRRNNLKHAYYAINKEGIIFSERVEANEVEIVFKKQFLGTDKHSYFNLSSTNLVIQNSKKYSCGIYVRFDWRNPNHIINEHPNFLINQDKYYYIIEKNIGKELFFEQFLRRDHIIPMGDKCISEDLIKNYIKTDKIKEAILKLYCSFDFYASQVGLEILDGCSMYTSDGSVVWSEINPDCMRVKAIHNHENIREDYDKDIWRVGGSSSKEQIILKWKIFNNLFIDYFLKNRFHQSELLHTPPLTYPYQIAAQKFINNHSLNLNQEYQGIFQKINRINQKKEIIGTIDISKGQPTLVKSSQINENHSDRSLQKAYDFISILPKIVVVDLDAAITKQVTSQSNNKHVISTLVTKKSNNIFAVGGGIRDVGTLNYYLNYLKANKIILSSNLSLLKEINQKDIEEKIIVEFSINQKNEVLTHGRTVNTGEQVLQKIIEVARLGVKIISMTFHQTEGHLKGIPREQFRDLMFQVPGSIQKVIIAGGISSLDDLDYIWGFSKAVPQLGSAIWKHSIKISQIYSRIINFDHNGLCPAIISDCHDTLLGQIFMNQQSIALTCQSRLLYRYSRKLQRVIQKGQQSGKVKQIKSIQIDCDNDCLHIIVDQNQHTFCHEDTESCFQSKQSEEIISLQSLQSALLNMAKNNEPYGKIQQHEGLAIKQLVDSVQQLTITQNKQIDSCADVIISLLTVLNSKGISSSAVVEELVKRSQNSHLNDHKKQIKMLKSEGKKIHFLGVMGGKHYDKIDKTSNDVLGIEIIREEGRNLQIDYKIVDQKKYNNFFSEDVELQLVGIKSKDMACVMSKNKIDSCFNYNIMMENYPKTYRQIERVPVSNIKLALIKKIDRRVDPKEWTPQNKGVIISEYPMTMVDYFTKLNVSQDNYEIIIVGGGTESYLEHDEFDFCDAIVDTGETIKQNNLEVAAILCEKIYATYYRPL